MTLQPKSRFGAFLALAAVFALLPVWSIILMVFGKAGFGAYLSLSNSYYFLVKASVPISGLFSLQEYGVVPTSGAGYFVAFLFYLVLAGILCWLVPLRQSAKAPAGVEG